MTTVFGSPRLFVSADSRWSYKCGRPDDNCKLRKFIVCDSELYLYAGDEVPIIIDQAFNLEIITADEYYELNGAMLEVNDGVEPEMQSIVLKVDDGTAIDLEDITGSMLFRHNLGCKNHVAEDLWFYMGSGGDFAKDFFYYSHKKKRKSAYLCNLVGAINFASCKDSATGGPISNVVWSAGRYFVRNSYSNMINFDYTGYESYIRSRILKLKAEMQPMDKSASIKSIEPTNAFVSQLRSGSSAGLKKVTMSSVTRRVEKALARKTQNNSEK